MGALDKAFESDGIVLNDVVGLLGGADDPSSAGVDAPEGSLYIRTSGQIWQKSGPGDTDWTEKGTGAGSAPNSYDGVITTVINLTAANKVMIGVDTTAGALTITLPDVSAFLERIYFIKWVAGPRANKVTIVTQVGQSVDGQTSIQIGRLYDTFQVIAATATQWWFI